MSEQVVRIGETSGDEILDVTFYEKDVDGEMRDFVNIRVPGDKSIEIDVEANDTYKARFARKYSAFKKMQDVVGTPMENWDDIPDGLRREFMYQGFRFVEQVAGAPDSAFTRIMGGIQWRTKAQGFLNRGKISSDDIIKRQQEQITLLQEQMAAILEHQPKRGRPAKAEAEAVT